MLNRRDIKLRGKEAMKANFLICSIVAMIFFAVSTVVSNSISANENTFTLIRLNLVTYLLVKSLLVNPLEVGAAKFFLNNREGRANFSDLLYGFTCGSYINVVAIMLMRDLKVTLWTLLFIIPGLIKGYEYYMIPYLLADDCNLTSNSVFERTKEMTNGYKFEIFVFDLSFIGWGIVAVLTLGLGQFYLAPYQCAARAEMYTDLC